MLGRNRLPFPALVGLEHAQQALLLLAIDPGLKGIMLAAPVGTGKSSLAHGIREILAADNLPFVELPASVDIENLLGGLDLEATLRTGKVMIRDGVLARADGGILFAESINLLSDASVNHVLSALEEGTIRVEREGVSLQQITRFTLIGAYDPAEGVPRRHLMDRVGLIAGLQSQKSAQQRQLVIQRHLRDVQSDWQEDLDFLRGLILTARDQLPDVAISDEQMQRLSATALAYGVEGQRVDLFAVRAACAAAAYELRDEVTDEDCEIAANLVILPRATQIPAPAESEPPPPQQASEPPAPEPDAPPDSADSNEDDADATPAPPQEIAPQPDQILEALEAALPESLEDLPFLHHKKGRSGSRGSIDGKRGRHIRSYAGDPRRHRIDILATLRAAAPWQPLRRNRHSQNGSSRQPVRLAMSDIRVKQYRSKAGTLFCFAVDASGSMALHRMRQAKGAVHTLLGQAYVNRDRVALISFRGQQAEVMLPPTQSVELAKRALDLLPTGGGTPLASALLLADQMAEQARQRGIMQTVLVVLTDGRANISLQPDANPREELQKLGGYLMQTGMHVIIVDTKRNYLSQGEAQQLAGWLGADYAYLPNADGKQIADFALNAHAG